MDSNIILILIEYPDSFSILILHSCYQYIIIINVNFAISAGASAWRAVVSDRVEAWMRFLVLFTVSSRWAHQYWIIHTVIVPVSSRAAPQPVHQISDRSHTRCSSCEAVYTRCCVETCMTRPSSISALRSSSRHSSRSAFPLESAEKQLIRISLQLTRKTLLKITIRNLSTLWYCQHEATNEGMPSHGRETTKANSQIHSCKFPPIFPDTLATHRKSSWEPTDYNLHFDVCCRAMSACSGRNGKRTLMRIFWSWWRAIDEEQLMKRAVSGRSTLWSFCCSQWCG